MVWNPKDYDGLTEIIVPSVRLWLPDIYVVNNADSGEKGAVIAESSRVIVKSNGEFFLLNMSASKISSPNLSTTSN